MSRWFIGIGIALIVLGLLWPWIQKSGLGRLPGDIIIEKEGFRFYFPITSMIIISLGLSLIIWIFRK
ncbi:MAG: DUF2905 domain-containing protein [Gammaproteobacteria bacterium]|nr:DUF2905 domain-containing protein [Gammaproteobacteria bacterium]